MKLTIAVPVMGQIEDTKGVWGCLITNTANINQVELLVIDNNSNDNTVDFLERFVFPYFPDHRLIHNSDNLGVARSLQQAYQEATGDVIAMIHNDLYIFEHGWNNRVMDIFEKDPKVGIVGFFGAKVAALNGGRSGCMSNFLEAEIHGMRVGAAEQVILFDGISLICRREMLDQVGGFDLSLDYFFYDKDISLTSHVNGWKNIFLGIPCHHRSGVTANRPDYQNWVSQKMGVSIDQSHNLSYKQAEERFLAKWQGRLPISI